MCRNIRPLFNFAPPATEEEIHAAALQYVRKVSGSPRPSKDNAAAFDDAVARIAAITRELVQEGLTTRSPPRSRETLAAQAKERGRQRELRIAKKVGAAPA